MITESKRRYNRQYRRLHRRKLLATDYRRYSLHRDKALGAAKNRYWSDPEKARLRANERYHARRKPLDARKLQRCRQNPQLAATIAGPKSVICLMCGRVYRDLSAHLFPLHKLTVAQYRTRFGENVPIRSVASERAYRRGLRSRWIDPRKRVATFASRRRHLPDWHLVERRVKGESQSAIGREFYRAQGALGRRLRRLGFDRRNCVYDFGQPFDSGSARWLKERSRLLARELASSSDVSTAELFAILFARRPSQLISPRIARKLIRWRDQMIPGLLKLNCSKPSLLRTFFPQLRRNYQLLLKVFERLRKFLRENATAHSDQVQRYLCDEARIEVLQSAGEKIFVRFLRWAPELMGFIESHLERFRDASPLAPIARECLAFRWSVDRRIVDAALLSRTRLLPPNRVKELILSLGGRIESAAVKPKPRKRGRPPIAQEDRKDISTGRKVADVLPEIKRIWAGFRALPERDRHDRDRVRAALRTAASSERLVEALTMSDRPLVAARWLVALETGLQYDRVAKYHRLFHRATPKPTSK